jgi:hemoglobin/transferrin/lactoferrin receptor protein
VFTPKKGVVVVPNTNLKPEYAYNIDFGIMKKFDDKINIQTSVFYTYLNDPIVQRDFSINGNDSLFYDSEWSKTQAFVNYQHATIYGASVELNGDITENFGIKSNISYSHGEDNEGNTLRHVAPLFGSTHIIFTTKKLKIDAFANYNGEIKAENLAPSEQGKDNIYAIDSEGDLYSPSWFIFSIKASYQIIDKLQINAGIENITDQRYRPYSSGICAPGRNFIVALRFKI